MAKEKKGRAGALDRGNLAALAPEARLAAVTAGLRELAEGILGSPADRLPSERLPADRPLAGWLPIDRPLAGLGIDSLSAVELGNAVESALGVALPFTRLLEGASLEELARELLAALETPPPASATAAETGEMTAASGDLPLPLTHGQRALWLIERLAPGNPAYILAGAARAAGSLDATALTLALAALVERHPALRSTFHASPEGPVRRLRSENLPALLEVDASTWSEPELELRLAEEAYRPFDLEAGPLLRLSLFRRAGGEAWLALAVHHVAADFWSLGVLLAELGALYRAGGDPALAALSPPPADDLEPARREAALLAGARAERLWEFWRAELAASPAALDLPTDRPRPRLQTFGGGSRTLRLDRRLTAALKELGRAAGATPFMTLLAGFQTLLGRITGQEQVRVGSPTAGRGAADLAGVVGYLVNPVVLLGDLSAGPRGELSGDSGGDPSSGPDVRELLDRTRRRVLAVFAHQELPFPLLAEALEPQRDPGRSPLFQAMLAFQKGRVAGDEGLAALALRTGGVALDLGGLQLESLPLAARGAQFELTLGAAELGGELALTLEFNTDLFDAATAERLLGHLQTLLAAMAARPESRLGELPLLSAVERFQLLAKWGEGGGVPVPPVRIACLHEAFERQARRTPEAPALYAGGTCWTYRELDLRSARLARGLRALGVGPEVPVGVCLERGPELVAALLGVLRAGGAYVPLDPEYPSERLSYTIADSGMPVLLTRAILAGRLAAPRTRVVDLETLEREAQAAPGEAADDPPEVSAGNLAYVIYTSGSTGRPKGVAIEHASATALLAWAWRLFPPADLAGVLAATSVCFDLSVFELFVPLGCGGAVVLAVNALELPSLPAAGRVTLINTVPSAMAELVRGELPASLRTVNLAGEPLTRALADRILERPGVRLFDLYGPSEDTTYSTGAEVVRGDPRAPAIGRPVAGGRVCLVDRRGELVPVGVPGEVLLGGAGLARGYLGRPELTAERFVPDSVFGQDAGSRSARGGHLGGERLDPNGGERLDPNGGKRLDPNGGERLYRTGDLARWRRDGELEFLGRLDHQVKVRGFRIELGEIEAALEGRPEVAEAVVVARESKGSGGDLAGDRQLVAYVAAKPAAGAGPAADLRTGLRAALRERLPEHMVPALVVVLPALPRTPNGKIDRKALPEPEDGLPEREHVAPRDPLEEALAALFADVLGVARVGVEDDFFALGGHSLAGTRILARVRESFGAALPLSALFETPTVAGLAATLRTRQQGPQVDSGALGRRPPDEERLASFAQERFWFLDQLGPGTATYNVPGAMRLHGDLDVGALAAGLGEIVRRHEVLRTRFVAAEGHPLPVVDAASANPLALPIVDLSALPPGRRAGEAEHRLGEAARRPFDLAAGPLLRVVLLRLGGAPAEHALLVNLHHVISDGASLGIFLGELAALYAAFRAGLPSPLAPLAVQYYDFAYWQRGWLAGLERETQLAYWRRQLAGAPTILELPIDRPRPAVQRFRGSTLRLRLPAAAVSGLEALGRQEGATLYMVLLAGLAAVLGRHAGSDDLLIGSPVAGRNQIELEGLIGCFVNTLLVRADLTGEPTARGLLQRVREASLGAHTHQELPFEALVEDLAPDRSLSYAPLAQVLFVWQEAPEVLHLPGVDAEVERVATGTAKFDLGIDAERDADGLAAWVEYDRDLFDDATVRRLLAHFQSLLEGLVAAAEHAATYADLRLAELPMLGAAETHQLLCEQGAAQVRYPASARLDQRFFAWASARPDAVAVTAEGAHVSYRELARRANALAAWLTAAEPGRTSRVGLGSPVALLVERSPELIVAILGVLAAGGAYVPLDPAYPAERLNFVLRDSGAAVLLTQRRVSTAELELPPGLCTVLLDAQWDEIARLRRAPAAPAALVAGTDDLAYVIYTSGSTGRPKGVGVTHGNAARLFTATAAEVGFSPRDVWSLFHSSAFDFSVWELWGALAHGGRLVVVPREVSRGPELFHQLLVRERVSVLSQTPSAFRQLAEADAGRRDLAGLRLVVFGGEALEMPVLAPWFERYGEERPRLVNMYGITETTVHVTWRLLHARDVEAAGASPIGAPLSDLALYLLDRGLRPVPLGVPGEIHVGGAGLARGYLGRPELTAERFVPDPFAVFGSVPGARLYRSGDLARLRADGEIEYLGRIDSQVKVRGFRIEVGEVEVALARHPEVAECAVVAAPDGAGATRLVAFVVASSEATVAPASSELRRWLLERLPEHMVPAFCRALPVLPLTANGKVDRKKLVALAAEGAAGRGAGDAGERPATPLEEMVAGLFEDLLGAQAVGRDDRFFDLGGHSLLATRLVSRLRAAAGVEVPLAAVFADPSVRGLAAAVAAALGAGGHPATPPPVPIPRGGPLALAPAQERLWFLDRMEPGSTLYNVPAAVDLAGSLDLPALAASLGEIVRRHEVLRTTFVAPAGRAQQVIAAAAPPALPLVDLSGLAGAAVESARLAVAAARRPFDLAAGPLLRLGLHRLDERRHVLLINTHHIVCDGWSAGLFLAELVEIYGALSVGLASPLPPLPIQYADFAHWQRASLAGDALATPLAYWRQRLAGSPPLLELPTDRPRPAVRSQRGERLPVAFSAAVAQGATALAHAGGATLFMTLAAGLQALLARASGQLDIAIGSPIAGRVRTEVEGLIGLFVNTFVLRTDLAGDPSFRQLLDRVREGALGAYAHQEVPFERLVAELAPERSLRYTPLFQVLFALQNAPFSYRELPSLTLDPRDVDNGTAKFDLSLTLNARGEGLVGSLEYCLDLFDAATSLRLLRHMETLLEGAVGDPERRLSELPLLSPAELWQLQGEWSDNAEPVPDVCIHELFEAQARRTPEAEAVAMGEERLTYRELDRQAERLAAHLRSLGVGPEVLVGICRERSPELLAAVLAVLKAGGAYVPLDPEYPRERLAYMLKDSGATVLVTDQHSAERLQVARTPELQVVTLEEELPARSESGPAVAPRPENLAYVIYTSGSTGRPKGVQIGHRSVVSLLRFLARQPGMKAGESLLAVTTLSFDIAGVELFLPLAVGGRVVLASRQEATAGDRLIAALASSRATVMQGTPASWALLLAAGWRGKRDLRVLCAGEALPPDLARRLLASSAELWNCYGPTETTIYSTAERVTSSAGTIAIGRPVANTELRVLSADFEPSPVGVLGELYIGGAGLSRGYRGRPDLTAERFVPAEGNSALGARLYKTGDLARWLPDGRIEYLGRIDGQVKVRGFRIELGEVAAVLREHPDVLDAVVVAVGDGAADRRLVAYVVPRVQNEPAPDPGALRTFLRRRLTEPMIPALFVTLEELPLTPSGKVDRRALPAPSAARADRLAAGAAYERPNTALEETVAAIWRQVLGLEKVGAEDNFFDLGGHSLLLAEVHARLQQEVKPGLSMVDLFRYPTIRALAAYLAGDGEAVAAPVRVTAARTSPHVAIVGMAGRFPGAANVGELWQNLCAGVESISFFSVAELAEAGIDPAQLANPRYVRARGTIDGADLFDADLFGFNPREAELLDPQQRVFLECAWEALEDAGYDPQGYAGAIGLFAGASLSSYLAQLLSRDDLAGAGDIGTILGNDKDFLPTRVSYKLDLKGPSVAVQTACSTSLVAVHLACASLLASECDMAMAGGVSIRVPLKAGYLYYDEGIASPDGHCRAFDADARGAVGGNGVGLVVLKPLDRALADGDTIHAVIRGSAINNDGANKVGYTAPSVGGQAAVIAEALARAGVAPETVGYVETHGTATLLGDPIEIAALSQALGAGQSAEGRSGWCAVGSIKTNVGHMDAAAGVGGLIKATLALEHARIPPSLHFKTPNPRIDFATSPVYVNAELRDWPAGAAPRRAGVSSFGIGGTNAHVVLEEPPAVARAAAEQRLPSAPAWVAIPLSARSDEALAHAARRLADHLEIHPELDLADVAFTLQVGRRAFAHRRLIVCRQRSEAVAALRSVEPVPFFVAPVGDVPASSGAGEAPASPTLATLTAVGERWAAGEKIDWQSLHAGAPRRRVPLPTYPFERHRYWVDMRPAASATSAGTALVPARQEEGLLVPSWRRLEGGSTAIPPIGRWLVLRDPLGVGERVAEELRRRGRRVVELIDAGGTPGGTGLARRGIDLWSLDPRSAADCERLLAALSALPALGGERDGFFHLWSADPEAASVLPLVRSLGSHEAGRPARPPVLVITAVHDACEVTGTEEIRPERAALLAAVLAAARELPGVAVRAVDVGSPATVGPAGLSREKLAKLLAADLDGALARADLAPGSEPALEPILAYRGRYRWLRTLEALAIEERSPAPAGLRRGGRYLALGSLPAPLAGVVEQLAREEGAELVREESGRLPVAGLAGRFDGVFAASAVPEDPTLPGAIPAALSDLESLLEAAREAGAAFLILSSSATVSGGPWAAATAALCELFARRLRAPGDPLLTAISWQGEGAPADSLGALRRALTAALPRVVVRVGGGAPAPSSNPVSNLANLAAMGVLSPEPAAGIAAAPLAPTAAAPPAVPGSARPLRPRRGIRTPYQAPANDSERAIAALWEGHLGISGIGVHDTFYELGGHSLLATQVVSQMRDLFGVAVPLEAFYQEPTIAALAATLAAAGAADSPAASVAVVIATPGEPAALAAGVAARPPAVAPKVPSAAPRAVEAPRILPRRGAEPPPLSFAQERLWFLDQWQPGNPAYNLISVVRLDGALDAAALAGAIAALARRHESLRTTFAVRGEEPYQAIAPAGAAATSLPLIDLGGLAPARRSAEAERLAKAESLLPFDLVRGPLLRTALLRLAAREHQIFLTLHHIVSDGWSMGVLLRELGALYAAGSGAVTVAPRPISPLPPLPIQYADYAVWQREWLRGERLAAQLDYWRGRLAAAPVLDLPLDRPRASSLAGGRGSRGGKRIEPLPAALTEALVAICRREGATLYMGLVAAFATLLGRTAGQEDLTLGSPIANRNRTETEGLIGFFVNTLVLRTDLAGDPSFSALLARVRRIAAGAYAHQDLPFEKLVEVLQPVRDGSHTPLFQVFFALQNAPIEALALPDLTLSPLPVDEGTAKFDLSLALGETADGLVGQWVYDADLFDSATIARLADHLRGLLAGVAANPELRLGELPLLGAAEQHQMAVEWNDPREVYPQDGFLHELAATRAAEHPERVAVTLDDAVLTYGELMHRANLLAARLRGVRRVGPEVVVGICAERSFELVIGLLAVLEAGGAYLPLDPSLPAERLAFMLADAAPAVVLAQERWLQTVARHGVPVVALDAWPEKVGEPLGVPTPTFAPALLPDHPAYVLYTSGSTGQPKGVVVTHRSVTNRLRFHAATDLVGEARLLQKTTISFDVSVLEIFGPLLAGGTVVQARPGGQQDTGYLLGLIADEGVTHATFPPSVLSVLLEQDELRRCRSLRIVVSGSEAVPADLPSRFYAQLGADLYNRYGPTEATIAVTAWRCEREADGAPASRSLPIGRPICQAEIELLDRELQPVPLGSPGELAIGGICLARGYLGQPELTAEKFVPDPASPTPGGRIYRTGDLARARWDGAIEFAGRIDRQVKIRGFRVELGEIESALSAYPGVRDAAVVDVGEGEEKRLVAYIANVANVADVAGPGATVSEGELQSYLAAKLPAYMVPSAYCLLEALPLSANGKVNRQALPPPPAVSRGARTECVPGELAAPESPVAQLLLGLWAELLGAERVAMDDDFFALGGHSLLATRLVSRVRSAFGAELAVREVFELPTPAVLARRIEALMAADGTALSKPQAPPRPAPRDGSPLPLSFAQERLWFLDQLAPGSATYNIPAALRLCGRLDEALLAASLAEIARRHEVLRATFPVVGGQAAQAIAPPGADPLPVIDLQALPAPRREGAARELIGEEARRPFDLAAGPLHRAGLLRLGAEDQALLLSFHHVVADGWSLGVYVRELVTLYEAFAAGAPSPLPPLAIQYADWARWQRELLQGAGLEDRLGYWRQRLEGAPARLELPTDRARPAMQTIGGAQQPLTLDAGLVGRLESVGRQHGATLFMVLLAGFTALLARWSGQEDVLVGSPIAGRELTETEGLIGLFVNTIVLRLGLAGEGRGPGLGELLRRSREAVLGAFVHADLPFEKLVDALQPERDLSHSPLFQAMLVLQNAPSWSPRLSGLALTPMAVDTGTAKFDVMLTLAEVEGALVGSLEHNLSLFDPATVIKLGSHLETLLMAAVAEPERSWRELPLLSPGERAQLLVEWNDGARPLEPATLHGRFEAWAERTPGQPAVEHQGETLSYRELDRRANRLADRLLALGVEPEERVAIHVERSVAVLVAILGVLKAGCAYIPLDPRYPRERLLAMLEDAGHPILLTERSLASDLEGVSRQAIVLDELAEGGAAAASAWPAAGVERPRLPPEALAYVLYTSGSTGRPKGVACSHRGVVNLLADFERRQPLAVGGGASLWTSLSFDVSVYEIFSALTTGGVVQIVPEELRADSQAFFDWLGKNGTASAYVPPFMVADLVARLERGSSDLALRRLLFGVEPIPERQLSRLAELLPEAAVINGYGPTEATVCATLQDVTPGIDQQGNTPIGRPVENDAVYLLDAGFAPSPSGVPGELCIGGLGLARCYLGRPEATAERFVPHPWSEAGGERLYRTGDLARRRPDGTIEFMGRVDHQVKLRGFRIELGDIESALVSHQLVREAVVLLAGGESVAQGQRLVAFVVPHPESRPEPAVLRSWLESHLPEYMVPAAFVTLEALPLSPNGKLDRKALALLEPAPEGEAAAGHEGPRTAAEELLARVWGEVLGVVSRGGKVGIHDNFFELGGNSILSIQIVSRSAQGGWRITPRQLFEQQTVARLAAVAEPISAGMVPTSEQGAVSGPVPLTPIQRWFFAQGFAAPHHFNQAVLLRPASGPAPAAVGPRQVEGALAALLFQHDALRLRFRPEGESWVQENAAPGPSERVPFQVVDLRGLGASRGRAALVAAAAVVQASLDLERGPLLRAVWLELADGERRLLLVIHHLAVDGVSWRVLLEDLETCCRQLAAGEAVRLPAKTTSFRSWASGLVDYAQTMPLEPELPRWLELGERRPVPLAVDRAGGANTLRSARRVSGLLTADETHSLLHEVPAAYGTQIQDALLAALALTLGRPRGALLVDLEGHGREEVVAGADVSRTVGWFTSLFPVDLTLGREPEPGAALKTIKERLRAIPERGLGFGLLRYLRGDEEVVSRLAALPKAEVVFNYLGEFDQTFTAGSLFAPAEEESGPSQDPGEERRHLLAVSALVHAGRLRVDWGYSENLHARAAIERWANAYLGWLRELIAHCRTAGSRYTPSDFPQAALGEDDLENLLAELEEAR